MTFEEVEAMEALITYKNDDEVDKYIKEKNIDLSSLEKYI